MRTKHLSKIFLSLLTLLAAACGGAGGDFEGTGGFDGTGGLDDAEEDSAFLAELDNDSAANPAADEFLSITGTREIVYTD